MIVADWIWIIGRATIDAALMLLWGCFGYVALAATPPLRSAMTQHLAGISAGCIALLSFATLAILPAQIAEVTDSWRSAIDPETAISFLTLTSSGHAWICLAAGSLLLVSVRAMAPDRGAVQAILAGLMLSSLALTGHAAMNSGAARGWHAAIDIVHLLSAGAWLGGLVGFVLVMQANRRPGLHPEAIPALRRFSTLGHIAVALVLLSGGANTLLVVGHLPTDLRSAYQTKLLMKIGLVAIMALTAIINRYAFVPLLRRRSRWAERALSAGSIFELAVGAAVIALVAALGTEDPA